MVGTLSGPSGSSLNLHPTVEELTHLVDAELSSIVSSREMPLYRMMSYHLGWSDAQGLSDVPTAKERIHGVLCLLACRAVGGDPELALPVAAAVELVHNFCLIHDDVQGGNPRRDDRDAVWWVWGPAQAINAGDGMHALARLAMFRLLQRGVAADKTFRAVQLLDEASLQTCEGRFLDLEAQERIDLSVEAYLRMASTKTGALVSCSMKLGALVASEDEVALDALGSCGAKVGLAMQMRADIRELWGDGQETPAPTPELMNKKKLLPVVYALEKATLNEKRKMGEVYFKRVLEPDDVARLRETIEGMGVRKECEGLVDRHHAEAIAALDVPSIGAEGRDDLERFMDSLLDS